MRNKPPVLGGRSRYDDDCRVLVVVVVVVVGGGGAPAAATQNKLTKSGGPDSRGDFRDDLTGQKSVPRIILITT